jgi:hypothetical protein
MQSGRSFQQAHVVASDIGKAAMKTVEYLLKSENFSVAARLDPLSPEAPLWLKLAAKWRIRALEENHGFVQGRCAYLGRKSEIELWEAIAPPPGFRH